MFFQDDQPQTDAPAEGGDSDGADDKPAEGGDDKPAEGGDDATPAAE